jgi:uncharacterized protein (UPF0276 family)
MMMKLAVNYSAILVELLNDHPALPVDYIKVPTIPFPGCFTRQFDPGARLRPLLPHPAQPGVLALAAAQPEQRFNPYIVGELIRRTNPGYLSTHLEVWGEYFPEYQAKMHCCDPLLGGIIKERLLTGIKLVKSQIKLPLILENVPYYPWRRHYRLASEPELISAVCEAGECGFLLDIAHARCSACSLKMPVEAYLKALPLTRLREIHLAGVCELGGVIMDTHTVLTEPDYQLLQMVLAWAEPEIVTLEYGGMPEEIMNRHGGTTPIRRNDRRELEIMLMRIGALIGK